MKTLTLEDDLYEALEEEAYKVGRTVGEIVAEAASSWLADAELDEEERAEIDAARAEAAEVGGVEADKFLDRLLKDSLLYRRPVG